MFIKYILHTRHKDENESVPSLKGHTPGLLLPFIEVGLKPRKLI